MLDVPKKSKSFVPIDCPVCEFMMRDVSDISQYYSSKCCVDCWIAFLEPLRLLKGDEGYLANNGEINAYRKKIAVTKKMEKKPC